MPYKVSFFSQVQQARLGGWSESFWSNQGDLKSVTAAATFLRQQLLNLKGVPTQMPNVRISDLAAFRSVTILAFPAYDASAFSGTYAVDYATTKALLKLTGGGNLITRQWIGGLQDADVASGGFFKPTPGNQLNWNALYATLTDGTQGWCIRKISGANPKKYIGAISVAGVVTCLGHGFATDNNVRISRAVSPSLVNDVWRIVRVDNDTFSLVGFPLQIVPPQVKKTTYAQLQGYTLTQISNAIVDRATKHNVGRPFGQLSGKAKAKK